MRTVGLGALSGSIRSYPERNIAPSTMSCAASLSDLCPGPEFQRGLPPGAGTANYGLIESALMRTPVAP